MAATVSVSRRSASGIALIIAGALFVLAAVLPLLGVAAVPWLIVLAYIAIAVALGLLGFGAVNNTVAKICLIAAAVGWLILALVGLGIALPAPLVTIAAIVAGVGGLVAAIVLYVGKEITNMAAVAFIVAMALGLLYLLGSVLAVFSLGTLGAVVAVLFGVALIIAGVLFRRKERSRR
ncbi:MAG: hypothetical protein ABIQ01_09190 [Pseudolysinimonas sp.]